MNNEFDWWLLIVGLVGGAGLVWLMLSTGREPTEGAEAEARQAEAAWIATRLSDSGTPLDEATAARILALHRDWETGGSEVDWEWEAPAVAGGPEASTETVLARPADDPSERARLDGTGNGTESGSPPIRSASGRLDPPV